eukprot:TRINITY_DN8926_c0_g1_i1.p2 TRINITY_DN8926_c0_g1~~TRINITY_DN8926_c0_g1_i1.p2  ORF type:complete len:50 (-),score=3.25 TRINITY_DN8926_c0_g1_i1:136-285(-)
MNRSVQIVRIVGCVLRVANTFVGIALLTAADLGTALVLTRVVVWIVRSV